MCTCAYTLVRCVCMYVYEILIISLRIYEVISILITDFSVENYYKKKKRAFSYKFINRDIWKLLLVWSNTVFLRGKMRLSVVHSPDYFRQKSTWKILEALSPSSCVKGSVVPYFIKPTRVSISSMRAAPPSDWITFKFIYFRHIVYWDCAINKA